MRLPCADRNLSPVVREPACLPEAKYEHSRRPGPERTEPRSRWAARWNGKTPRRSRVRPIVTSGALDPRSDQRYGTPCPPQHDQTDSGDDQPKPTQHLLVQQKGSRTQQSPEQDAGTEEKAGHQSRQGFSGLNIPATTPLLPPGARRTHGLHKAFEHVRGFR